MTPASSYSTLALDFVVDCQFLKSRMTFRKKVIYLLGPSKLRAPFAISLALDFAKAALFMIGLPLAEAFLGVLDLKLSGSH